MTNDNTTRKKANAVFFSVIMVISMAAVGFAAAPAAATATSGDLTFNDQKLAADGSVLVEDVSASDGTDPDTGIVVITAVDDDTDELLIAGIEAVEDPLDGDDVSVTIEDDDQFPGVHNAHLFNDSAADGGVLDGVETGDRIDIDSDLEAGPTGDILDNDLIAEGSAADIESAAIGEFDGTDYDRTLTGNETVYQGQLTLVNVNDIDADEPELRRVDSDGNVGALVSSPSVVEDGTGAEFVILDTANRDADQYVVTGEARGSSIDFTSDTRFEVVVQDVDFEFEEDSVDNAGDTEVDVDIQSDIRNRYAVTVTAEDPDGDDVDVEPSKTSSTTRTT